MEQSSFCDIVCKSPETQQMAKIFAEDSIFLGKKHSSDFNILATKMVMFVGFYGGNDLQTGGFSWEHHLFSWGMLSKMGSCFPGCCWAGG